MSTILIGHASISEKGTVNGLKGDSTGKEVCTRTWYSKPWDFMAIHPDANVREKHAKAIEAACANDNIGYGQSDRNTLNTLAKTVAYDLSKVGKCNCDCSALQNVAAIASGASGVTYGSNGWTTSTMKSALQSAGYKIITDSTYLTSADYCVRGAIYVKSGSHTVAGLTDGSKASQTLYKAGISSSSSYITTPSNSNNTQTISGNPIIALGQAHANNFAQCGLVTDGIRGTNTRKAAVKVVQRALNCDYNAGLVEDGDWGSKTDSAFGKHYVTVGETQYLVTALEILCMLKGIDPKGVECPGKFGEGLASACGTRKAYKDTFKALTT